MYQLTLMVVIKRWIESKLHFYFLSLFLKHKASDPIIYLVFLTLFHSFIQNVWSKSLNRLKYNSQGHLEHLHLGRFTYQLIQLVISHHYLRLRSNTLFVARIESNLHVNLTQINTNKEIMKCVIDNLVSIL